MLAKVFEPAGHVFGGHAPWARSKGQGPLPWNASSAVCCCCVTGPEGARGEKGDSGPMGPEGPKGELGERGKRGKRVRNDSASRAREGKANPFAVDIETISIQLSKSARKWFTQGQVFNIR